ncbi:hypothetical protein OESDEN_20287 [Oesophagostomum dentatum]|uniref:Peptidase M13 C-terminal domain-containing protein n=1 Tax=Oesophagostomum dentatum TaxID=61180 RepID=A0A0B1S3V8_OESDE|nr:hypothetical protein OESDEN_20287 [Oesophagostomum dentatum]
MFFLGYATKHCARYSFEGLKQQLTTNEHSLEQLRVNKVVANNPAFAEAFHCAPGKKLNPPKRCEMY